MAKNIILLSDGTGNSSAKLFKTNVWRLYQALDLTSDDQIAYFDDGVGTSSFKPLAILGGGLGYGLKRNVVHLYMFLCRHYKPGDRIFGFGFSRGAFTIRLLMGLVACEGLVPYENSEGALKRNAKNAYRAYRRRSSTNWLVNFVVTGLRTLRDTLIAILYWLPKYELYSAVKKRNQEVDKIHFLGLWDTVDAYGLPMDEMTRGVDLWIWPLYFSDQKLSPKVERACHALSIDDERTTFHPVLWTEEWLDNGRPKKERVFPGSFKGTGKEQPITNVRQERLSQVWFAGVHADVGGGYPDDGLAHVPLNWIMDEAESRELKFRLSFKADMRLELAEASMPLGATHNSRSGFARYFRYGPRKIELLCDDSIDKATQVRIEWPKIHHSVFKRIEARVYGYAPIVLPDQYAVVMEDGEIRAGPYDGIPLPVPPNPYEHGSQSASRANRQEVAWDYVWHRRFTYFAALFVTAYLVLFPVIHGDAPDWVNKIFYWFFWPIYDWVWVPLKACLPSLDRIYDTKIVTMLNGGLKWLVATLAKAVEAFVPGSSYAKPWLTAYQAHPGWFCLGVLALFLCILRGSSLRSKIFDGMREIWSKSSASPKKGSIDPPPNTWLYKLRSSAAYLYALEYTKWYVLPTVFAFIFFFLVFTFIYRLRDLVSILTT